MPNARCARRLTHGMRDPNFGKAHVPARHAPAASHPGPKDDPSAAARQLLQDNGAAAAPDAPATNITSGASYAAGNSDLSCVGCSGYDTRTQVLLRSRPGTQQSRRVVYVAVMLGS